MNAKINRDGIRLTVEQSGQWVDSITPVIDKQWRWIDAGGHKHSGDDIDATTEARYGDTYWCDDCRDYHEHFVGLFCNHCGAEVHPKTVVPEPTWIPGPITATLIIPGLGTWSLSGQAIQLAQQWLTDTQTAPTVEIAQGWLDDACYRIT